MKKTAMFLAASVLLAAAAFAGDLEDLAVKSPALPAIDAGAIWNQVNQHPFPQPSPTTLDTCVFTEFKNNKCYFKCQSGAVLIEPAVKPDFSTGEPVGACAAYIIRPIPAPAFKAQGSWAREAATELRKELKQYGVTAKVIVVDAAGPGQEPFLAVEFQSWKDYDQIKDLFYQDPGDNPSYMGVKISPRVPKEMTKADLNWKNVKLQAADGTRISIDYSPLSLGSEIIAAPLWITVIRPGSTGAEKVRAVVMNYYDSSNMAANTLYGKQELDLKYNGAAFQAEGQRVELSQSHIGYGYNFRQEIAVVVDGKWLTDPVNGSHNFKFKMYW